MYFNRRKMLLAGMAAPAIVGVAKSAAADDGGQKKGQTIVTIHGGWESAAAFTQIVAPLARRGHRVVGVTLPGHGFGAKFPKSYFIPRDNPSFASSWATEPSPVASITLDHYVAAVKAVVDGIRAGGVEKVILVAHSAGGMTMERYTEMYPETVAHMVYISAVMPNHDRTVVSYFSAATTNAFLVAAGNPFDLGVLRVDWNTIDPIMSANIAKFMFNEDPSLQQAIANIFTPDEPLQPLNTPAVKTVQRWGRVPRTYTHTLQDGGIFPVLQEQWISEADAFTPRNKTNVVTVDGAHLMYITQPELTAQIISDVADKVRHDV